MVLGDFYSSQPNRSLDAGCIVLWAATKYRLSSTKKSPELINTLINSARQKFLQRRKSWRFAPTEDYCNKLPVEKPVALDRSKE
jgi:hypothetical protein